MAYRQPVGADRAAIYELLLEKYQFTEEARLLAQHPWLEGAKPLLERAYTQYF